MSASKPSVSAPYGAAIELKVERIAHLFDALDPFPIPTRDLSPATDEFIVGWARDLSPRAPIRIVVHAPREEAGIDGAVLSDAFHQHFAARAERMSGDLRELFRFGRLALSIGLAVLVLCVIGARLAMTGENAIGRIVGEGLLILGWVANWRPLEIFLYEWWPIVQKRRLFRRLAAAQVELVGHRRAETNAV